MIDGNNSSNEWQAHIGAIGVLPVGSFEQHGAHLPLATDILGAKHFARMVAQELDAALLPALPMGTCLEHSGFRGSISLRPETLMLLVRDIADEMERQGFRVLILVNGHGGNFVLGPVARDINRLDRSLKLLLLNWWEFLEPGIACDGTGGPDFHAGEMETSLMMALHPEMVGEKRIDAPATAQEKFPLSQSDLTIFGMGHFAPAGAVGFPSLATPEKGEAILASVRARMLPFLRDRLRRLDEQPRYCGRGGIIVRALGLEDLVAAMHLKECAGWNQTEDDWQFFLETQPQNCFAAVQNGRVVGAATAMNYGGALAWIGMMLVDPQFRRMGVGNLLLERALEAAQGCDVVGLDATAAGKQLYDRRGFSDKYRLRRMIHPRLPHLSFHEEVLPYGAVLSLTEKHWPGVLEMDREVFGANRAGLLRRLFKDDPAVARCFLREDHLRGFCLARRGANFHHIGPVVAEDFSTARALLAATFDALRGEALGLDVADSQTQLTTWLEELGFKEERAFIRMTRDGKKTPGAMPQQFAIAGPEFG